MVDIFKQVNLPAVLIHIAFIIAVAMLLQLAMVPFNYSFLVGALIYFVLSMLLRKIVPADHNSAMSLLMREDYEMAQKGFERSFQYFSKNQWIDDYRVLTMMSASNISYREMALINQALCYLQMGKYEEARAGYEAVLVLFPNSRLAKQAIDYLDNPDEEEEKPQNF